MNMKQYIVAFLAIIGLFGGGYLALQYSQNELAVGSDAVTPIAGQTYTLAGSGLSSSDTSFTLTSFTITQNGYRVQDSDMSDTFYVTLEPGSRSRQEIASCTTVTQNGDGTATISGCTRGLLPITPYTASSSMAFAHAGGSTVIFSDPPQLFNEAAFKDNDETITGNWLIGTPLSSDSIANKAYVDALVSGTTTLTNDRLVVAGTGGETLATSTLVYFNPSTQRWNGVSSASSTTFVDRFIGLTQGAGTNGTAITNGILLKGRHTLTSGLTPGSLYYAATATGTISATTSTQPVAVAVSATDLYFDPVVIDVVREGFSNTFTATNTFNGVAQFNSLITGHASTVLRVYTATSTWTKPAGLEYITIWVCGAGGSGSAGDASSNSGAGGGSGGCGFEMLDSTELAATTTVVAGVATGPGAVSSFGNFCTANSGTSAAGRTRGSGGTVTGCDLNINGAAGTSGSDNATGDPNGSPGANSFWGIGGGGGTPTTGNGDNGTGYGAGGGGGAGSAGGSNGSGGTGAAGIVIITEYY